VARRAKGLSLSFKKLLLWQHVEGKCQVCGIKTDLSSDPGKDPSTATLEHIKPKSKGGTDAWNNLALLCSACNQRNANKQKYKLVAPLAHYSGDSQYMSNKVENCCESLHWALPKGSHQGTQGPG